MLRYNNITSLILIPIAGIIACTDLAGAETLVTKNFQIKITRHCEEGNVTCDRVTYVGKSFKTGKSIFLTGQTLNSRHTYNFLGYEFQNGRYRYVITNDNVLLVYKSDRLILREQGELSMVE